MRYVYSRYKAFNITKELAKDRRRALKSGTFSLNFRRKSDEFIFVSTEDVIGGRWIRIGGRWIFTKKPDLVNHGSSFRSWSVRIEKDAD